MTTQEWIAELQSITVLELAERIHALEETFGVSAKPAVAPPLVVVPEEVEEQTSFTVRLVNEGQTRMQVIKALRSPSRGLKAAKDLVDAIPIVVESGLDRESADALKATLEEAGAEVVLE